MFIKLEKRKPEVVNFRFSFRQIGVLQKSIILVNKR